VKTEVSAGERGDELSEYFEASDSRFEEEELVQGFDSRCVGS